MLQSKNYSLIKTKIKIFLLKDKRTFNEESVKFTQQRIMLKPYRLYDHHGKIYLEIVEIKSVIGPNEE